MSPRATIAALGALAGLIVTATLLLSEREPSSVAGPLVAALVALLVLRFAPSSD